MSSYVLDNTDDASDATKSLDKAIAERTLKKLNWLAENAEAVDYTPLRGDWKGYFRLRAGEYRVIYFVESEQEMMFIEVVRHRRDIYD